MDYDFVQLSEADRKPVIDIFNHFVEKSYAAYPDSKVPYEFYDLLLKAAHGYPAIAVKERYSGTLIGFAFMKAHSPFKTMDRTAELSYFLLPEYTGKGIGSAIIEFFVNEARKQNIDCLLASISSLNDQSLNFHEKMGFFECGRFKRVGKKNGQDFDEVWMEKLL